MPDMLPLIFLQWYFLHILMDLLIVPLVISYLYIYILVSFFLYHYADVIMTTMASQITSLTVAYSTVYSDADQRKHQSSASLAFVWGIHRDRWIPRTKGQLRGKCFHLMTSSWWRALYVLLFTCVVLCQIRLNKDDQSVASHCIIRKIKVSYQVLIVINQSTNEFPVTLVHAMT